MSWMTADDIEALERVAEWAEKYRRTSFMGIESTGDPAEADRLRRLAREIARNLEYTGYNDEIAAQLDMISDIDAPKLTAMQWAYARWHVGDHITHERLRELWFLHTLHGPDAWLLAFYRADREQPGAFERWYENDGKTQ